MLSELSLLGLKTQLTNFSLRSKSHFALNEGHTADPQKPVYKRLCLFKAVAENPHCFKKSCEAPVNAVKS